MAFKTSEKYKSVIYSGDCRHKLKLLFNGVELEDADVYCESLKVTSRILPNGSTRFSLDNFIAKEAELILHDIDTTKIQSPVNISIGTLVDGTYEYVPIGLFVVQDLPTTDKNKTTIKLRDYAVKFDFGYNAKDIIDENDGSVTKLQILKDICNKAGVETDITKFYGSNSKIGIYDNTITGRTYISYLAEQAGAIATIDRSGKLIFVQLKDLETVEIPLNIVEKYEDGEKYEISRVVYEDAIRKFEYGDESKDTLFINTANPYIDDEVLTNTLTGTQIETSNSSDNEVVNYKQYGYTKQNVYSGKQLLDTDILNYSFEANTNGYVGGETGTRIGFGKVILNANTKYYISYDVVETGTTNVRNTPMLVPTDGSAYSYQFIGVYNTTTGRKVWEFTPTETKEYVVNYWCNTSDKKVTIANMMVSTDSDISYEPYVGGKASPSPDYPQEIEVGRGKNLFNKDLYTYDYVTNNDTGNTSDAVYKDIPIYVGKPNTAYFVSTNFLNGYTPYGKDYMYVLVADYAYGNSHWVAIGHTGVQPEHSYYNNTITSDNKGYLYLRVYKSLTKALYEELMANVEVQIEEGNKKTSYLPYNTIKSKSIGKNLAKVNNYNVNVNNMYYQNDLILDNFKNNTTYTLSFDVVCSKEPFAMELGYGDNNFSLSMNGIYLQNQYNGHKKITFTTNNDSFKNLFARIPRFNTQETYTANVTNIMLVEGDVEQDYEPYEESYITCNLGDNFLADKDYIQDGVLNKNVGKVVLNGSENWTIYSYGNEGISFMLNLPTSANVGKGMNTSICDKYTNITQAWGDKYKNEYGIYSDHWNYSYKYFRPPNADITTVEQWKAWLSENNIEMYYQLETPEQIQLETTGELRTFEPNTIITNDLDSEMEVEYKMNRTQVSQILELNKNISLNSFKTGKIIGNPAIDAYDIIKIIDGDKEFKTLATNDLTYNGVMINTFDTQIGKEAKKENVTLTPEATLKKWAKTEIDNVEASVKITTGKIEEAVLDLETDVNNNSVNINNNYQEILGKFEGYTPTSQTIQLEQSVTQLQTDTYTKTEINTKLTDGSVTKVRTTSGTFDENGMHYEKTGAPTKSTINEAGVSVDSSSSGEELLFAGYDKDINQTIVRTENLTVRRYLVVGKNTRIEDYTDEDGNVGGGLFIL